MSQATISLQPVDAVKVTVIMDNSLDLLMTGTEVAQRVKLGPHPFERNMPIGEHGFSVLINVKSGDKSGTVLFDTGLNPRNFLYNLDALEVNVADIQAIILSHGHADHAMGLAGLTQRLGNRNMPLLLHPDAYLERKIVLPNGDESFLPPPRKSDLLRENIQVIEEVGPSMLVDDMVLVSGEVARTTTFEKGFAVHYAKHEHGWEPDPFIHDDQCAIIHVREKGLVVITGCGHSGIINIIRNAQALTGIQTIYAVIGGFHLTGALFVPSFPPRWLLCNRSIRATSFPATVLVGKRSTRSPARCQMHLSRTALAQISFCSATVMSYHWAEFRAQRNKAVPICVSFRKEGVSFAHIFLQFETL